MLRSFIAALVVATLAIAGCSDSAPTSPLPTSSTTTSHYDVTYKDNVVYLDSAATERALVHHDVQQQVFTFAAGDSAVADIQAGTQLLVFRKALREVASVTQQGNTIVVQTKGTTFDKVFETAEIDWEHTLHFDGSLIPTVVDRKGGEHQMTPVGPDSFDIEVEVGDLTYKIFWKMKGDDAKVDLHVEKKIGEVLRARYSLSGTLHKFKTKGSIRMQDGTLEEFELSNPDLKGDFTMSVNCAGSGNDAVNLELPVTIIKVPITVGPLVVVMNVRVQVVVNSVVPADGSSLINADFSYQSSTGFSFKGGQVKGLGGVGTYKIEKGTKNQTGASTAVAANFGLGFPRLEFKLFDADVMVPWVQTALLLGGDYAGGVNPCQQARAQFIGAAGVNFQLFGHTLKRNVELWNMQKTLLKTGACP